MLPLKIKHKNENHLPPVFPPPFPLGPSPFMIEGPGPEAMEAGSVTSDYEFYPWDPISRFVHSTHYCLHPFITAILNV